MLGRTFFILVAKTRITLTSMLMSEIGLQFSKSYIQVTIKGTIHQHWRTIKYYSGYDIRLPSTIIQCSGYNTRSPSTT